MTATLLKLERPDQPPQKIALPDGTSAERIGDALEIHDGEGRLLLRFEDGRAELMAPAGDLKLSAPHGAIVMDAAQDVIIRAARDVIQHPARRAVVQTDGTTALEIDRRSLRLTADDVSVMAKRSRLAAAQASVVARDLAAHAERFAMRVERYELSAARIVEKSRDTFRETVDLLHTKAGRARTFVSGVSSLFTRRTVMLSDEDTSIDGKKVLLG